MRNFLYKRLPSGAQVAQLVEQRTENPCVGGSIPPLGTTPGSIRPVRVLPLSSVAVDCVMTNRPGASSGVVAQRVFGRSRATRVSDL